MVNNASGLTAKGERKLMASTQESYEQWKRRIENRAQRKGLKQGLERGLQEGLLAAYQARFGAMPGDLATAIASTHDPEVLRGWFALVSTASAAEIAVTIVRATLRGTRNAG